MQSLKTQSSLEVTESLMAKFSVQDTDPRIISMLHECFTALNGAEVFLSSIIEYSEGVIDERELVIKYNQFRAR